MRLFLSTPTFATPSLLSPIISEDDSPYPEVRAAVANTDDPDMSCATFRAWFVGLIWAIIIPGLDQFFFFRYPSVTITGVSRLSCYRTWKLSVYTDRSAIDLVPHYARVGAMGSSGEDIWRVIKSRTVLHQGARHHYHYGQRRLWFCIRGKWYIKLDIRRYLIQDLHRPTS